MAWLVWRVGFKLQWGLAVNLPFSEMIQAVKRSRSNSPSRDLYQASYLEFK
jgi:hypothetical protein